MKNKTDLNKNDQKLLAFCYNRSRFISEIARYIGIDVKNVSTRIDKLEKKGLIYVERVRNKKYIRTKQGDKTKEYFIEILKELKEAGGEMIEKDFMSLLPYSLEDESDDKFSAPLKLLFLSPSLVDQYIRINSRGEKFLKENLNKKNSKSKLK